MEGGHGLSGDPMNVARLAELGVVYIILAHLRFMGLAGCAKGYQKMTFSRFGNLLICLALALACLPACAQISFSGQITQNSTSQVVNLGNPAYYADTVTSVDASTQGVLSCSVYPVVLLPDSARQLADRDGADKPVSG